MKLSYLEDFDSQIPAIQLLGTLGWKSFSREETLTRCNRSFDRVMVQQLLTGKVRVKG